MAAEAGLYVRTRARRPSHGETWHPLSTLPMHGKQKELGTGLVNRIKKTSA